jgi:hypothetical protein
VNLADWIAAGRKAVTREEASRRIVRRWLREHRGHAPTLTL